VCSSAQYMCMSMQVTESVHSEIVDAVRSIQFHSESFLSHGAFEALVSFSETISRIDFDGNVISSGLREREAGRQVGRQAGRHGVWLVRG